jgi:hypothetical protein
MENIADLYYEKLEKAESPGKLLAKFYEGICDKPGSIQNIVLFNKLVKVYGKYIPFFAILDLYSFDGEVTSPYGLLSFYCKRRMEQKMAVVVLNDAYKPLDGNINKILEQIEKQKENPIKIRKL